MWHQNGHLLLLVDPREIKGALQAITGERSFSEIIEHGIDDPVPAGRADSGSAEYMATEA